MKQPVNRESEIQVLGVMLLNKEAIHKAMQLKIEAGDFYYTGHRFIFQAIIENYEKGIGVDLVTVAENLKESGRLQKAGGATYLTTIISAVATPTFIEHYIQKVFEASRKRKLLEAIIKVSQTIEAERSWEDISLLAKDSLYKILEQKEDSKGIKMPNMVLIAKEIIKKAFDNKGKNRGLMTGFPNLSHRCPIMPKELVVLGGAPRMGKSALCLTLMYNIAKIEKKTVLFFSCEMTKELVGIRLTSLACDKNISDLLYGKHSDNELYFDDLIKLPIIIDEVGSASIDIITVKARQYKREHPDLCFIAIDHIGFLSGRKTESRQQELTEISTALSRLTKELELTIVVITQLVKDAIERKPGLADIRESGALAQDADVVWFLYREIEKTPDKAILIVAKQRNGEDGIKVELGFENKKTRFYETNLF